MEIIVKPLDANLVHQANMNSMGGTRGDTSVSDYENYCNRVMGWPISDEKKQKIIGQVYEKCSAILQHEARHVSVMVAGPARYNAKKLDHSDAILRLSSEFVEWFQAMERQIERNRIDSNHGKRDELVKLIEFSDQRPELDPTFHLAKLANIDNAKFVELFESLLPKYRWRKNSNIYKLYLASKEGKVKEIKKEVFFEDANLTAYTEGDRAFIHFTMKPARQLIVALKSRKWWWNSGKSAWSTYLDRLDREWVAGISTQYAKYV